MEACRKLELERKTYRGGDDVANAEFIQSLLNSFSWQLSTMIINDPIAPATRSLTPNACANILQTEEPSSIRDNEKLFYHSHLTAVLADRTIHVLCCSYTSSRT